MKPCPFCHELIQGEARKCKHCGEMLDPALREGGASPLAIQNQVQLAMDVQQARTKAGRALAYGIIGIVFFGVFLGPAAIVLGVQANNTLKRHGQAPLGTATAGLVLGIIDSALWVVIFIVQILVNLR